MINTSQTITLNKRLKLNKRKDSPHWQAMLTLECGKRERKSTKTDDLDQAKEFAWKFYYETDARVRNNLPAQTRKFKHVAEFVVKRLQDELDQGIGKSSYKDYISALRKWHIPFFGAKDIAKIDANELRRFEDWRAQRHKKPFSQSGICNHNAALSRVFDEAELHGWIKQHARPTLRNKGVTSQSRGSFTKEEYRKIQVASQTWHTKTRDEKSAATREVLRNYILFLSNTGVRHGTEALNLRWKNIEWQTHEGERYLVVNVDGKTGKRSAIAKDTVEGYLDRQRKLNPRLQDGTLDELIARRSDEFVFTTRLGEPAKLVNLMRAFERLLKSLDLKRGADGKKRTLYSYRHYYATRAVAQHINSNVIAKQMGNSPAVVDKWYNKNSPINHAALHSGRLHRASKKKVPINVMEFELLAEGHLDEEELLAALGVDRQGYLPTEEIKNCAYAAKVAGKIGKATLLKLLAG